MRRTKVDGAFLIAAINRAGVPGCTTAAAGVGLKLSATSLYSQVVMNEGKESEEGRET